MIIDKIKDLIIRKEQEPNKKKIENVVIFLIISIITILVINNIWNSEKKAITEEENSISNKKLATELQEETQDSSLEIQSDMIQKLEEILSNISGVGKVKVMVTYSRTSQTVPIYNEDTSEKNTEETDTQGGTRTITETDTKKEIIYKEEDGEKTPITQSVISPIIQGAIITAEGAGNAEVKTNIIQAVEAVTGLATHKVQVFEMSNN